MIARESLGGDAYAEVCTGVLLASRGVASLPYSTAGSVLGARAALRRGITDLVCVCVCTCGVRGRVACA